MITETAAAKKTLGLDRFKTRHLKMLAKSIGDPKWAHCDGVGPGMMIGHLTLFVGAPERNRVRGDIALRLMQRELARRVRLGKK